ALRPEYRQRWDTIIVDEAHYIKGRKTTWTRQLKALCKKTDRVILATGTPMPNWAEELFEPLGILWPEKVGPGRELNSYWRWADKWFDTTPQKIYRQGEEKEVAHVGDLLG